MTTATSVATSRSASTRAEGGAGLRFARSVVDFVVLTAAVIRRAREMQTATTDRERRQLIDRPLDSYRAA